MGNKLTTRCCLLFLAFVVLGVYYPAIFSPLNSVDDPRMYDALLNTDCVSLRQTFLPGGSGSYYRPLVSLSFLFDKYAWGLEESFMHLENVLFHLLNALLVFAIARRASLIKGIESPVLPFLAALFFAVHPINTEAVNWISGRTDLLAGFFLLMSVLFLLPGWGGGAATALSALLLLLACLAKESSIFFLPAALILPFFAFGDRMPAPKQALVRGWPSMAMFGAAGGGYFLLRSLAFARGDEGLKTVAARVAGGAAAPTVHPDLLPKLHVLLKSAGFYAKKLFNPFPLNFGINHVPDYYLVAGVLLVTAMLWCLKRRTVPAFFLVAGGGVACSALLVPFLGITWTPIAERYMYMPSAFFVVAMAFWLHDLEKRAGRRHLFAGLICVLAVVAVCGTVQRTILWQDNLALFRDTVAKSPDFLPAKNQIACALFERGRKEEANAIFLSMSSPKGVHNYQRALLNKAFASEQRGELEAARGYLNEALKDPGTFEIEILLKLVKLNEAEVEAKKATQAERYPESARLVSRLYQITGDPFYQYRLGQLYMFQHEKALAKAAFDKALAQAPPKAIYREPARILAQKMSK